MKTREQIVHEASEKLLEMFKTGQMPEAISLTIIKKQQGDDQPSYHWSIGNQILMYAQGTTDARGYDQWRKVDRFLKKGSSAIYILGPLTKKIKEEDEEKVIITGFRPIPIFRYEDTDGQELIKPDYSPPELPPLWNVAEFMGIKLNYAATSGGYYGKFSPSRNEITLCSHDACVYFHELAHAVHGQIRANLKAGQDAEQEIVAETAAAVLCQQQGIDGYESQAYDYIQHYTAAMKETDVIKAIMRVLHDVEAIVTKVLEAAEKEKGPQAAIA